MSRHNEYKLQNLLASWPFGTIATTKWLETLGISRKLASKYKSNGWLKSFGQGAFCRPQDKIDWYGALYALQFQLDLNAHIGAKTALELHGFAHDIPMGRPNIDILKSPHTLVPRWFFEHPWEERMRITQCNLLPPQIGMEEKSMGNFSIKLSSRERAVLELVYLAPRLYSFDEIPIIMTSLGSLRGNLLRELLTKCTSEKVKRLILYFGDKHNHAWRKKIDEKKLQIGSTPLKIVPNEGKYNSKYNILLPKAYVIEDEQEIKF